ncbi:MAG: 6-phosphofructokinase [Rickettsiales bacterium]|nr:6-phosphofructokinase [Rickettsiales bacterium]
MSKKIGLLTSGGDCAGLNALIRSVYLAAKQKDWTVIGIEDGIPGLITRPIKSINIDEIFGSKYGYSLLGVAGTCLGTLNKPTPPATSFYDNADLFIEGYRKLGLDALVASGGDGSLSVLRKICQKGNIPFVGVPKTIDNDIDLTDSLGFATAVEVATEALDRLQPTAASHSRTMILEVMGRDAGNIALHTGIAGDADVILLPEVPYELDEIAKKVREIRQSGRTFALIVVAEAAHQKGENPEISKKCSGRKGYGGIGSHLCDQLGKIIDGDIRATTLGHVQRGGRPGYRDRLLAAAFGAKAIECIENEKFDCMVAWHNSTVTVVPLEQAIKTYRYVDLGSELVKTAIRLGISFGVDPQTIGRDK